ncbi:MAG TPA: SDR family oxidoreductase [Candidatus Babeliaceae bacterium]|nr:SDR family oxidoreductase [Candidatus Babeliaceae bacterium]
MLNDGASVVILSSIVASTHKPYSSVCQASKAALHSMAKTAATELASRKIRVNVISPRPHTTEIMTKAGLDKSTLGSIHARLIDEIPLKKMGDPQDVAKLVLYFCDEHAIFITGGEVIVDGGMTL